jgi:hypothetical protein
MHANELFVVFLVNGMEKCKTVIIEHMHFMRDRVEEARVFL